METLEKKRDVFIKILKEICDELNYSIELFSQDWIIKITNQTISNYILAYNFGINNNASAKICADKTATTEILNYYNLPNVQHRMFHIYDNYQNEDGNWKEMINFFYENNQKVVLKPNVGSSGIGVSLINNLYELEKETYKKLNRKSSVCLSPFEKIIDEYRVVLLKDEAQLIFKKIKPILIGNGQDSVFTLLYKLFKDQEMPSQIIEFLKTNNINLNTYLKNGEIIELNWKHNLGSGAVPKIVELNKVPEIILLAKKAVNALNMKFASVDIIKTVNGDYKIMEVNSGVMLINFALNDKKGYNLAKKIYMNAIIKMMSK